MNDEILKIGKATKWRGDYDNNLTYYEGNLVTMYGSVFHCKADKTVGKPPIIAPDVEKGLIQLANIDVWECIVDAVNFYNRALDGVPFDTAPLEGSNNGVTSGATYSAIKYTTTLLQDQIDAINLGAKLQLSVAPNVIFRNQAHSLVLKATVGGILPQVMKIVDETQGNKVLIEKKDVSSITHSVPSKSYSEDNIFRVVASHTDTLFTTPVKLLVVDKLFYGSGTSIEQIVTHASERTTPAGTYTIETKNDGDYIWFLVPNTMAPINKATLNGLVMPFVQQDNYIIGDVTYYVYCSANTYLRGTRSIVLI